MTENEAIQKVIDIALAEVGYHETGVNVQKYGKEMHQIQPSNMDYPAAWCDAFVDWCFYKAFGKTLAKRILCGNFDDYTVISAQLFMDAGRWTQTPKKGYQIFFKNSGGICHTGLVYKVSASTVYTVEGNSSDAVQKRSYDRSDTRIAGYGMPKYNLASDATTTPTATTTAPTTTGRVGTCSVKLGEFIVGSIDPEIKTIQILLNSKGYRGKDGRVLDVDGELGANTAYAITNLQKQAGMVNINFGTVSTKTWNLLLK